MMSQVPHPIPYQGSKRKLAPTIYGFIPRDIDAFYEPFAGSAAMTLYMASRGAANRYIIADKFETIIDLWQMIVDEPRETADRYEEVWQGFSEENPGYFNEVRARYNENRDPVDLLYLVCRCVKNAVRFNSAGNFTQSADKRRKGTNPKKMRAAIFDASELLKGRTEFRKGDWVTTSCDATVRDFVYMDPPYLGTSVGPDKRYHQQLEQEPLISGLAELNARNIRFALSYDGMTGDKEYGPALPGELGMHRLLLHAGRSTQATLQGKSSETVESLYLSRDLDAPERTRIEQLKTAQQSLAL
ncbi:MAG: DNA methyltransferase [Marinobacter sp.]|nr:MAG: DNA methyltransferase [Marinobacter sp.]